MLTNTHSVGVVRDAVIAWRVAHGPPDQTGFWWSLPVVAETWDGWLNDVNGFHVKPGHVDHALDSALPGPVAEGSVGGGTGMICYEFKGGIGTASRRVPRGKSTRDASLTADAADTATAWTVGVLVQANHGLRSQLTIAGVPVGREIPEGSRRREESGSIIIIVATDAPLLPHQCKRLARRAALGLARTGSVSGNGSGDLFLAFSTANSHAGDTDGVRTLTMMPNEQMSALFAATVQATEEAIINALVAAEGMTGRDGHRVEALPHDRLRAVLEKYGRLR